MVRSVLPLGVTRRESLIAGAVATILAASDLSAWGAPARPAGHVVLLGDSIFDNQRYVGAGAAVSDHLRRELPKGWEVTLGAIDGSVVADVAAQVEKVPREATHLIISAGGNDALLASGLLAKQAKTMAEAFLELAEVQEQFRANYAAMLKRVLALGKPTAVCTIYDPCFADAAQQRMCVAALGALNDCITRAAVQRGVPVVDLRVLFDNKLDYANTIEPSAEGGRKMAAVMRTLVVNHDFGQKRTVVYV